MNRAAEVGLAYLLGVARGVELAARKKAPRTKKKARKVEASTTTTVYGYGTCAGCNDDEVRLYSVGNERLCREYKP